MWQGGSLHHMSQKPMSKGLPFEVSASEQSPPRSVVSCNSPALRSIESYLELLWCHSRRGPFCGALEAPYKQINQYSFYYSKKPQLTQPQLKYIGQEYAITIVPDGSWNV